jgi:hypothetical protein
VEIEEEKEKKEKKNIISVALYISKLHVPFKERGFAETILITSREVVFSHWNLLHMLPGHYGVVDLLTSAMHAPISFNF